jgi:predicted alpha/beta-hydrolase family hydrolase
MVAMARAIAERGVSVVTFNFVYAEQRKRVPDRANVLEDTWLAALAAVRAHRAAGAPRSAEERLFIGGKSMGGRIATQIAAREGVDVAGIVLLGYPLHPPGKPTQLRKAHLPHVRAPMLFVQGSRDAFGTPDELRPVLGDLPLARLLVVEGGDHSLTVPKKAGVTLEQTMARVADAIAAFTNSS